MQTGRITIMGDIDVPSHDGNGGLRTFPLAVLVTFPTVDAFKEALKDGVCKLSFGEDIP
jgi:hypothetical protein